MLANYYNLRSHKRHEKIMMEGESIKYHYYCPVCDITYSWATDDLTYCLLCEENRGTQEPLIQQFYPDNDKGVLTPRIPPEWDTESLAVIGWTERARAAEWWTVA